MKTCKWYWMNYMGSAVENPIERPVFLNANGRIIIDQTSYDLDRFPNATFIPLNDLVSAVERIISGEA